LVADLWLLFCGITFAHSPLEFLLTSGLAKRFESASQCSVAHGRRHTRNEGIMLYWAAVFFVIAIVAAAFGFGGIAAGAVSIAKILFVIFLVLFLVSAIAGIAGRRGPPPV
jgi:uncharacterized membrane protein YtjA (UPF0391 family)